MQLPMIGTWKVTVNGARPFTIHGDQYFEVHMTHVEDRSDHLVRVPVHAVKSPLEPGKLATVTFLMGQVTEVIAG
ncbi:hypothetical protein [Humisphaera borealis]|uniref:Uncharacterized protein n=1 Tax=Humisphaera borealis TaxID=2807512 RepID=A0A7M2X1H2_9BACT|nr:hypothetical protein [Humisphaera borealis]QOV91459.1 hypothetical protein IPV69_08920 [Humisphaera borealis]